MSQESPREGSGGLAYEVTLAEAKRPVSPPSPKEKMPRLSLTQQDIDRKLQEAEARRVDNLNKQLEFVQTDAQRMEQAQKRAAEEEEKFKQETAEKVAKDLQEKEMKRQARIDASVARLRAHAEKVKTVQAFNEKYIEDLRASIEKKLLNAEAVRQSQLEELKKKLDEHMNKIVEGRKQAEEEVLKFSKETEEKLLESMETAWNNRLEALRNQQQKLKEHEKRIEEVRANKQAGDS